MEKILILDFGSQYTKLIAKAVRELEVYDEIGPPEISAKRVKELSPQGIILSGGPNSVYADAAPELDRHIYELNIPILGICYGMQLMARDFGGRVERGTKSEYGTSTITICEPDTLLQGLDSTERVWMSHGDEVRTLPPNFIHLARTESVEYAAMISQDKRFSAIQFHPEVHHTAKGKQILRNFLFEICKITERWRPADHIEEAVRTWRERLKLAQHCLIGVSGGVDSSVAAVLMHRAIGDRLIPVFIDTGILRKNEAARTKQVFEKLGLHLRYVNGVDRFLEKLKGVTDPEEKRKKIGEMFIRVFEDEARHCEAELGKIEVLVQGTIYSDVIESAGVKGADKIKSHHNVGGLPHRMQFSIVEPLRAYFKDEVRQIGSKLGLPAEIIWEQPFPGPGLAVRILGEVTRERVAILQEVDAILREEIGRANLDRAIWQYFAVLLPVRSVAVLGDSRGYGQVVALRAVNSVDGMTADWYPIPYDVLGRISTRITNEVEPVTRVVYDITSKPPGTIEWE
jgi:GMP synthase (glutamine-hydrolysing)